MKHNGNHGITSDDDRMTFAAHLYALDAEAHGENYDEVYDNEYDNLITLAPRTVCVAPSLLDAILEQAQVEYVNGLYRGEQAWSLDEIGVVYM